MATSGRRTEYSVADLLYDRPYDFNFFQAVRLLRWVHRQRVISQRGQSLEEPVRFKALQSLSFPPSQLYKLERPDREGGPSSMTVNFMGLTGPLGVLPAHYTEYTIERRVLKKDITAAAFFDLFNHRFISLFYLAWEKHNLAVRYEAEVLEGNVERSFSQYIFDLIGMGAARLRGRLEGIPDSSLLPYSGLFGQQPHSVSGLEGILRDYFQIRLNVHQFQGRWVDLARENLSYMEEPGLHNQLGIGAIAGDQVWMPQARFRIRVGPLPLRLFQHFLPGGSALVKLINLARHYVGTTMDFDVQVILDRDEVPPMQLTDEGDAAPRLGLMSWLKTDPFESHPDDLIVNA